MKHNEIFTYVYNVAQGQIEREIDMRESSIIRCDDHATCVAYVTTHDDTYLCIALFRVQGDDYTMMNCGIMNHETMFK